MKTERPIDQLLTWAYRTEAAGQGGVQEWATGWGGLSRDGVAACARNAAGLVGNGSARIASTRGHPDADAIHDQVQRLPRAMAYLLRLHAAPGTAPDWMPGAHPRPVPRRSLSTGRIMTEARLVGGRRVPTTCLLSYEDPQDLIDERRAIYLDWWEGLELLRERFELRPLRDWVALPPSVPKRPWEEAAAAES